MIWFTADLHLWHTAVIRFAGRPVASIEAMHEWIIKLWEPVKATDTVYILGDVSFAGTERTVSVLGQLKGHLKVVPGNHDDGRYGGLIAVGAEVLQPLVYLRHESYRINLCHFPIESWRNMHHGAWHLHGHSHGTLKRILPRRMDVGIDCAHRLFSFDEVRDTFTNLDGALYEPTDHHETDPNRR
jgi:calcineurin-like phosphoesterase family protein